MGKRNIALDLKREEAISICKRLVKKYDVVVENFRAMFFWGLLLVLGSGMVLTRAFVEGDHTAIIRDVFGGTNLCTYLDFPPSNYILPFFWLFPVLCGVTYCTVSMFRIGIGPIL